MENFIKVSVFLFIALWAQTKSFGISTEDIKVWSKKLMKELVFKE